MYKKIEVESNHRIELIDITSEIDSLLKESKIVSGQCVIFVPHTTAGILINENYDPSVSQDIVNWLNSNIPPHQGYLHLEGNADAHIKSSLIGNTLNLIIEANRLRLGRWQGIFFAEFDGPRKREVWVSFSKLDG